MNCFYAMRPDQASKIAISDEIRGIQSDYSETMQFANLNDFHVTLIHYKEMDRQEKDIAEGLISELDLPNRQTIVITKIEQLGCSIVLSFENDPTTNIHEQCMQQHSKKLNSVKVSRHPSFKAHISLGKVMSGMEDSVASLITILTEKIVGKSLVLDRLDVMERVNNNQNSSVYHSIRSRELAVNS